jgi:hypothetical protein
MRLLDNEIYLELADMVECGVSENTILVAKTRASKSWEFKKDPADWRRLLIKFDALTEKYKTLVKTKYGNPYEYYIKDQIKKMVVNDVKAERFYLEYIFGDDRYLSKEHVAKYTQSASWLNMIVEATKDKKALKERLGVSLDAFFKNLLELIDEIGVDLPTNYMRLYSSSESKVKRYIANGYQSIISPHFGNEKTKKLDENSEAILVELLANPKQFDAEFIAQQYNVWALQNGKKDISASTVRLLRQKRREEIIIEREGVAAFKDQMARKIRGKRPSAPLYLVEHDDNTLDLLFASDKSKFEKYNAVIVKDSYNDYILGYAYVNGPVTIEVVKAAYINAMYHLKSLTENWHLPHEIKSDRWALATLKPYYKSIATYIDSRLGNKSGRGFIEQSFGTNFWKNCLKLTGDNYTGNNITAKNRGVNVEFLAKTTKNRQMIGDEASTQIEQFFFNLRHLKQSNGYSKQEEWLLAWVEMPEDKKRAISDEQFLQTFGIEHNYRGNGVKITTGGIDFQINNCKYSYQLEQYNTNLIGKTVSVIYDSNDLSRVLLTNHDDVRVMATTTQFIPRALADHDTDSIKYMRQLQEEQNKHVNKVADKVSERKKLIRSNFIEAEAILQAGVIVKEVKHKAETLYIGGNVEEAEYEEQFNPLDLL